MASVKIILWKHDKKNDETFPLAIRITKNRKTRYIFTGKYVKEKGWDKSGRRVRKSHPNSTRLNNYLLKKLSEAQATILEAETSNEDVSTSQIKRKLKRQGAKISFFQLAAERIENKYNKGTFSVAKSELSILYNIEEFISLNHSKSQKKVIAEIKERRKK